MALVVIWKVYKRLFYETWSSDVHSMYAQTYGTVNNVMSTSLYNHNCFVIFIFSKVNLFLLQWYTVSRARWKYNKIVGSPLMQLTRLMKTLSPWKNKSSFVCRNTSGGPRGNVSNFIKRSRVINANFTSRGATRSLYKIFMHSVPLWFLRWPLLRYCLHFEDFKCFIFHCGEKIVCHISGQGKLIHTWCGEKPRLWLFLVFNLSFHLQFYS